MEVIRKMWEESDNKREKGRWTMLNREFRRRRKVKKGRKRQFEKKRQEQLSRKKEARRRRQKETVNKRRLMEVNRES